MKQTSLFHIICIFCIIAQSTLSAQVITTDPVFPLADQGVKIIFNAAEGNAGLAGYTGDIWAHAGVITDKSASNTDWKYVIAEWSENTDKASLTSLGNDLWELNIEPTINDFYAVAASDTIKQLAFVFRNSDGTQTGRASDGSDIMLEVYQEGLNITILQPNTSFVLVEPSSELLVEAAATMADSIQIIHDGNWLFSQPGNDLNYSLSVPSEGIHEFLIKAFANGSSVEKSFSYMVRGAGNIEDLPDGAIAGINYTTEGNVILVLYAPEKEFVFTIGDFNDWQIETEFLMKQTPDGDYFWIELSDLELGKEYVFQYFIDASIRIADPYTNKTSDPWNDHYISDATYPNLISYPAGKTSQIASVLQTGQEAYQWQNSGFQAPEPDELVIYELLIRDFLDNHSFSGLIDTLDYLQTLGINALELMPVNEFEGNDSWGYNTSFYFAVDKYYGPADSFKALIDSAHQRGMAVIVDMVMNHAYGQCSLVRMYWDSELGQPAANNPWFNQSSPNPVFSWGYDYNHESEATKRFVDSVNSYWLNEYQIDGFRFDFTKGFTNTPGDGGAYDASRISILKRMSDKIWSENPDTYVILEHFAANSEETELANHGMMLWGNMNHAYRIAAKGYLGGGASDLSWISYEERGWNDAHAVGFMESHDEERLMYSCYEEGNTQNINHSVQDELIALQRMELAANLFIPIPGPKMIWMFGELGYDYSIDYNGRVGKKPIKWDYYNEPARKRLYQVYSALNHLKQDYPVFQSDDFELIVRDTVKRINLNHSEMNVSILGNFSTWSKLGQTGFQHTGWWYEYWTGDSLFVENTDAWLSFDPSEYRIYTDVRLEQPDIVSGISPRLPDNAGKINMYPNPASDRVWLSFPDQGDGIEVMIFDLQGKKLMHVAPPSNHDGMIVLDLSQLPPGVMIVKVIAGGEVSTGKLIHQF